MKKILFLCSRPPYPLIGGDRIRLFNSIKMLKKIYIVDVLFINDEITPNSTIIELRKICNEVVFFDFPKRQFYVNVFLGLLKNKNPLQINYYYFKKIQIWINENQSSYSCIYCNHIRTTEYVKNIKPHNKIVDFVDSIAMNYEKAEKNSKGIWKFIYKIDKKRVAKYEVEISKLFDKKIIISNTDKEYIVNRGGCNKIEVINNFISVSEDYVEKKIKSNICFLGKMNYEPNVTAMKYFVSEIYGKLLIKIKKVNFYIIGAYPTDEIKQFGSIKGITVTGFVDNPKEYLLGTDLIVAPMVSGAGVQNKILEAMSLGKCIVTTAIGVEGLENLSGEEIVVCDSSEEMIEKIIMLLEDKEERERIGDSAKKYIKENLTEDLISERFLNHLMNN